MKTTYLTTMFAILVLAFNGAASAGPSNELPIGGRTIAGPAISESEIGVSYAIQIGNSFTPKNICTTVVNLGNGLLQLGGLRPTAEASGTTIAPGETKALCDFDIVSVTVKCLDGTKCKYNWRIDQVVLNPN